MGLAQYSENNSSNPESTPRILKNEKALPGERGELLNYACSIPGCDWKLSPKVQFFEVIQKFSQHNQESHGSSRDGHILRVYLLKT